MIDPRSDLPALKGMFKYVIDGYAPYDDIWRELPRDERAKHEIGYLQEQTDETGDNVFTLHCKCGWLDTIKPSRALRYAMELGHRAFAEEAEPLFARVINGAEQHMREVMAPYCPTLADFADWGWFCPEAP